MAFKAYVTFDTVEFTPDEGEKGRRTTMVSETVHAPTATKLRDAVQVYLPVSLGRKDAWQAVDDGLSCSGLVDVNNYEADASDIKAWEAGQKRLWLADGYVRVYETQEVELSPADAARALGVKPA